MYISGCYEKVNQHALNVKCVWSSLTSLLCLCYVTDEYYSPYDSCWIYYCSHLRYFKLESKVIPPTLGFASKCSYVYRCINLFYLCRRLKVRFSSCLPHLLCQSTPLDLIETGKSLKVQAERPHLVSLGSGRLSTAITLLPLLEGELLCVNLYSMLEQVKAKPTNYTVYCAAHTSRILYNVIN